MWLPVCIPAHQPPPEKWCTLKGKNLLFLGADYLHDILRMTICMKFESLFSGKNKKNISVLSSEILPSMIHVEKKYI